MDFSRKFLTIFLFLLAVSHAKKPLNILIYSPVFGGSHSKFMGNIADTLTEVGHNVTFLVPVADVTRRHEIGVKNTKNVIIVDKSDENGIQNTDIDMDEVLKPLWLIQNRPTDFETCFQFFIEMMKSSCEDFTSNRKVFEEISKTQFDVAIAEPVSVCGLGYFDALGIKKIIIASSTTHYEGVVRNTGEPIDMSYVPVHGAHFNEKMNIFQRYTNWAAETVMAGNLEKMFDEEMERYQKNLGKDIRNWRDLIPSASLMFTNANQFLDFPRPILQKTIGIGGISVDMEKIKREKLPEEIGNLLNKREFNMLISFGSMVKSSTMPLLWRNSILSSIKQFPNITFIWKYESDDLKWAEGIENLHFLKWIQQTALLNDKRVNAFLTHGGLGSTNELAFIGKPAIIVPIFGDQGRNGPMLERHGGALVLHKYNLDEEDILVDFIQKIVFNKSYAQNAEKLSKILNSSPFSPKELVIKNTEFVAEFGPLSHMDPYIRQLNWFQKSFFDIYLLMFLFYSTVTVIPIYVFYRVYVRLISSK